MSIHYRYFPSSLYNPLCKSKPTVSPSPSPWGGVPHQHARVFVAGDLGQLVHREDGGQVRRGFMSKIVEP